MSDNVNHVHTDTVAAIPRFPADVTGEWLTSVLRSHGHDVAIDGVDVTAIGTGQVGATFRVVPRYLTRPTELPDTFVVKLPAADDEVRRSVSFGYRSECAFYASVNEHVGVPAPECYHVEISEDALDFVLLLADQHGAVQGDQLAGCGPADAELAARALAGLHGPTWNDPYWRDFDGLAFNLRDDDAMRGLGDFAVMSVDLTLGKIGDRLRPEDHTTLAAAMGCVLDWLITEPARYALLHGDYRLDNLLFHEGDERLAVVDWQTLGVGLPARDLAYFAGTSLEPALRRSIEAHLVDVYHEQLRGYGVVDYPRDLCWDDYRRGMIQALLIPCIAVATSVETERGSTMFVTMIERGCQAIRDLDTLSLVHASTSGVGPVETQEA